MPEESVITNYRLDDDQVMDNTIRPESIEEYIGQEDVKENIRIFVEAAKMRNEPLDHVLLYGPPGLGKTTLLLLLLRMNLVLILKLLVALALKKVEI